MKKFTIDIFLIATIVAMNHVDGVNFNGKIAGGRKISECVNGYKPSTMTIHNREMYITTSQFIRKQGYPAEEHVVVTDDGYILTLHRIPGKPGALPVFLQHGFVCSSFDWVVTGKRKALAFKLADAGYDVWLGNTRGNTYGRCHTKYDTSSFQFWDFSWHEIGVYDLPSMITHITNTTGQKVTYIGHSMGTTTFFVMAIERPEIASKVKMMIGLAPAAFMHHSKSPLKIIAPFTQLMEYSIMIKGTGEFLSQSSALKTIMKYMCTPTMIQRKFCIQIFYSATGFNSRQFNYTLVPEILYHYPAGSSLKTFIHYFQQNNAKRFQYYDYGAEENLKIYKSNAPPNYNISKITVPIGLFWSKDDITVSPIDVKRLYEKLPNAIFSYRVDHPNFNHNDFLYGIDAPEHVYDKVVAVIKDFK